jgi:hypothetical protein
VGKVERRRRKKKHNNKNKKEIYEVSGMRMARPL